MSMHDLRKDYSLSSLDEANVDADPIRQFHRWFEEAVAAEVHRAPRHGPRDRDAGRTAFPTYRPPARV